MTALWITLGTTLIHLTAMTYTWRYFQARYLEREIAKNVKNHPSLYCDPHHPNIQYRRGYTDFDRTEARFSGFFGGMFWPFTLTWLGLLYLLHLIGTPLEVVPPTEKRRRADEAERETQKRIDQQAKEIRRLERELGLATPTTVEALRKDQP